MEICPTVMEIHDGQNNGNTFNKAEQDLHNKQYQLRWGNNIQTVENLIVLGDPFMARHHQSISTLLNSKQLSHEDLRIGADLTERELEQISSATGKIDEHTLHKISTFLGFPLSALRGNQDGENTMITINIDKIQIDGGVVSFDGGVTINGDAQDILHHYGKNSSVTSNDDEVQPDDKK